MGVRDRSSLRTDIRHQTSPGSALWWPPTPRFIWLSNSFGMIDLQPTENIWTIGKSLKLLYQNHSKKKLENQNIRWKLGIYLCIIFLQLFLISLQRNLSVVAFKTNNFFFHLLKSWKKFLIFDPFFKES